MNYDSWLKIFTFLETERHSNIFNSKYTFQIAFIIYKAYIEKRENLIIEDIVNSHVLTCSDCAARSFVHQLVQMHYISMVEHPTDKRKKVIKCQNKLVAAFE